MQKYSLYTNINDLIAIEYSKAKLGDLAVIKKIALLISELVKNIVPNQDGAVVYTIDRRGECFHKNSYILAQEVANILNIDLYHGQYYFKYNPNKFYDNTAKEERVNNPTFLQRSETFPHNKPIIIIDDLIYSGKTLESILPELLKYSSDIYFFTIIDLSKETDYTEQELNQFALKDNTYKSIINIINTPGYIFTTQMLRSIGELDVDQRQMLKVQLPKDMLQNLLTAYSQYHESEF